MKITFIGHASILIETKGLRILSDPWWRGPCFGTQWWTYPLPHLVPLERPVDYIYISHGHNDHFHPGTLRTLNQNATVLVSRNIDVGAAVRELGKKVVELGDEETYEPSPGVRIRIVETHAADTLVLPARDRVRLPERRRGLDPQGRCGPQDRRAAL